VSRAWAGGSTRRHRAWRLAVLERDHWTCQVRVKCEGAKASHADHVVPLSEGGARFDLANGRASCAPCNLHLGGLLAHARLPVPRTWSW